MEQIIDVFLQWFYLCSCEWVQCLLMARHFKLWVAKNISIEDKGLVNGKYSLTLRVNDMTNVYKFQLSELMLVNDCSFHVGKAKWTRPEQEKNEFDINWNMNGTYAFLYLS